MRTNWYGEPMSLVRSSWLAIERMAPRRRLNNNEYASLWGDAPTTDCDCGTRETEREHEEALAEVCYA